MKRNNDISQAKPLLAMFPFEKKTQATIQVDEALLEEAAGFLEHVQPAPVLAKEDFVCILKQVSALGAAISKRGSAERRRKRLQILALLNTVEYLQQVFEDQAFEGPGQPSYRQYLRATQ